MSPTRRFLQRALPVVVTAASLGWVFTRFDMAAVAATLTPRVLWILVPALLIYGAITIVIEALSVLTLLEERPDDFTGLTVARIKSASYLLQIVSYAIGSAALTLLLSRRAGISLGRAASVVLTIAVTDLSVVLSLGALGLLGQSSELALHGGLVAGAGALGIAGFVLLRTERSLGPIERLRALSVFDAVRHTPLGRLARLAGLRLLFSACFIAMAASAFVAFQVNVATPLLVGGVMTLALIGAIPIAVSGLGPGQVAAVAIFEGAAPPETLIAVSLVLSVGLIVLRAAMGFFFAREFTREALEQVREEEAG